MSLTNRYHAALSTGRTASSPDWGASKTYIGYLANSLKHLRQFVNQKDAKAVLNESRMACKQISAILDAAGHDIAARVVMNMSEKIR
jgi:hypothetical protein